MKPNFRIAIAVLFGFVSLSVHADYLRNSDFKQGIAGWRGDATIAFLKADGTEGSEEDPGVTPVLKLALSPSHKRSVFQEFSIRDHPPRLHFSIEIMASPDFKRSTDPKFYPVTAPTDLYVPKYDFWFRFTPYPFGDALNAIVGDWKPMSETYKMVTDDTTWTVNFSVPPGEGAIYVRKPLVEIDSSPPDTTGH